MNRRRKKDKCDACHFAINELAEFECLICRRSYRRLPSIDFKRRYGKCWKLERNKLIEVRKNLEEEGGYMVGLKHSFLYTWEENGKLYEKIFYKHNPYEQD